MWSVTWSYSTERVGLTTSGAGGLFAHVVGWTMEEVRLVFKRIVDDDEYFMNRT